MDRQIDRKTDRYLDSWINEQIDRLNERYIERWINKYTSTYTKYKEFIESIDQFVDVYGNIKIKEQSEGLMEDRYGDCQIERYLKINCY